MDNGHYHPTEVVSDKIPALLCFFPELALHVTRGIRWDSDHTVLLDDETKEIAKEIVRNDALNRVYIAMDYFDASINRISAWTVGMRSMQKALLNALCTPCLLYTSGVGFDAGSIIKAAVQDGTFLGAVTQSPLMMGYYAIYALTAAADVYKRQNIRRAKDSCW